MSNRDTEVHQRISLWSYQLSAHRGRKNLKELQPAAAGDEELEIQLMLCGGIDGELQHAARSHKVRYGKVSLIIRA